MTRMTKPSIASLLFALSVPLAAACGGGGENLPPPPPPPPPPPVAAPTASAPAAMDAGTPTPPLPPVTLLAGAPSPDPTPAPTVHITAPTKGQSIPTDKIKDFMVKLDVKNWQTAQGSQHVHLILDHNPYKPIYDTKAPIKLSDVPGGDSLGEGQHILVAFPSRPNHESVKTPGAMAIVEFFVGKGKEHTVDVTKPFLVYSRPKGNYNGDMANHVLVDFQLANDTLADGKDHVHITVSGAGIDANTPLGGDVNKLGTPFYLDNLQNGTYTVKLDLMSGDNKPVPGGWNSTSRDIQVNHDAANDMPMGPMPAPGAASDAGAPKPKK